MQNKNNTDRVYPKNYFHKIILTCLFLSIFSFSITSYVHLVNCHQEICKHKNLNGFTKAHSHDHNSHECYICSFLLNNPLLHSGEGWSVISKFYNSHQIFCDNPFFSPPTFLLNFARAPPGI